MYKFSNFVKDREFKRNRNQTKSLVFYEFGQSSVFLCSERK